MLSQVEHIPIAQQCFATNPVARKASTDFNGTIRFFNKKAPPATPLASSREGRDPALGARSGTPACAGVTPSWGGRATPSACNGSIAFQRKTMRQGNMHQPFA